MLTRSKQKGRKSPKIGHFGIFLTQVLPYRQHLIYYDKKNNKYIELLGGVAYRSTPAKFRKEKS